MPKISSSSELTLHARAAGVALPIWLYRELRGAILSGRLERGSRLPATRDLAKQHNVSRGTVVTAFEQLIVEGYLQSRPGAGTFVNTRLPAAPPPAPPAPREPVVQRTQSQPATRVFRFYEPALDAFPMDTWARIASSRLRRAPARLLAAGDPTGYAPLRDAVADYLRRSRGVVCQPEQIFITSGTNHSLDLIARLLIQPHDPVWMEDPGYPGATAIFRQSGARIIPVRVDDQGMDPRSGMRRDPLPKAIYLTPAHQFPLGVTMPLERRLALLEVARTSRAYILEDDYDSEFRYSGRPVAAMQGLDPSGRVIFLGGFNKTLFTALRLGYMVVPGALVDPLRELRFSLDRFTPTLEQAVLCDFLTEGHFGRHLRRMRDLYSGRLDALRTAMNHHLAGAVTLPDIQAGLHIPAHLTGAVDARVVEEQAARRNMEAVAIQKFQLKRKDINALLLGFAAFEERVMQKGVRDLADLISRPA